MNAVFERHCIYCSETVNTSTLVTGLTLCDKCLEKTSSMNPVTYLSLLDEVARLKESAGRWDALVNCARIRPIGNAGLTSELDPYGKPWNGYAHLGLELWTKYHLDNDTPVDNSLGINWLTKFVDIAAAVQSSKHISAK